MNWERAGWYPAYCAYWEYCIALTQDYKWQHLTDDWVNYVDEVVWDGNARYRGQSVDLVRALRVVEVDDDVETSR
jgi:hypothetical protein